MNELSKPADLFKVMEAFKIAATTLKEQNIKHPYYKGPRLISKSLVKEVNRIIGTEYHQLIERYNEAPSVGMGVIYLSNAIGKWVADNGTHPTYENLLLIYLHGWHEVSIPTEEEKIIFKHAARALDTIEAEGKAEACADENTRNGETNDR